MGGTVLLTSREEIGCEGLCINACNDLRPIPGQATDCSSPDKISRTELRGSQFWESESNNCDSRPVSLVESPKITFAFPLIRPGLESGKQN